MKVLGAGQELHYSTNWYIHGLMAAHFDTGTLWTSGVEKNLGVTSGLPNLLWGFDKSNWNET